MEHNKTILGFSRFEKLMIILIPMILGGTIGWFLPTIAKAFVTTSLSFFVNFLASGLVKKIKIAEDITKTAICITKLSVKKLVTILQRLPALNQIIKKLGVIISAIANMPAKINQIYHIVFSPLKKFLNNNSIILYSE